MNFLNILGGTIKLIILLIDDYHDIHRSQNNEIWQLPWSTHQIYYLWHIYISSLGEEVHNPMIINVELVTWTLQLEYINMSKLEKKRRHFFAFGNQLLLFKIRVLIGCLIVGLLLHMTISYALLTHKPYIIIVVVYV